MNILDPPVVAPAPKKLGFWPCPAAEVSPDLLGVENPEKGPPVFVACVLLAAGWLKLNPPELNCSPLPDKPPIFIFPKIDGAWLGFVPDPEVILVPPKRFELDVEGVVPEGVPILPKGFGPDVDGAAPEVVPVPPKGFVDGAAPEVVLVAPKIFELDVDGTAVLVPPKRFEVDIDCAVVLVPPKRFELDVEGAVVPEPNGEVEFACPNSPLLEAPLVDVAPKENSGKDFG